MATYIVLLTLTDEGAKQMPTTPARAAEIRKDLEGRGFRYHGLYWTQGPYDAVIIADAPSDEAMMRALAENALRGRARSLTMRAFTTEEMLAATS